MGVIFVSLFVSSPLPPSTSPLFITPYHRSTSATFPMETILRPLVNTPMPTLPARSKRQGQLMCPHTQTLYSPPSGSLFLFYIRMVFGVMCYQSSHQGSPGDACFVAASEISDSGREQRGEGTHYFSWECPAVDNHPSPYPHAPPPLSPPPSLLPPLFSPLSPPPSLVLLSQVLNLSADVLRHVPEPIDYEATAKLVSDEMNPLNVVLLQEVSAYFVS